MSASAPQRIGILGGTFDPPHVGHLMVAADVFAALELDRLLLIPSASPPHKQGQVRATAEQRLAMVRTAADGDDRFEVDDIELRRPGASYTVDTLRELRTRYHGAELFFVIGMDQFRELHTWREPEEVARLARLAVVSRDGDLLVGESPIPVVPVAVTRIDLSATDIRRRIHAGESIRYFVPDPVREFIEREGLYK
ncbi:MAG: nicotinate-nucleotide adenylyltransferase [Gemmatimonadetes bacterium]|nr:nicotinate-nucleotide adenylyltransferase [Gemmatimonadota bacterium]